MILDFESQVLASFLQIAIHCTMISLDILILGHKSLFLGPTIFEIPQPCHYLTMLHSPIAMILMEKISMITMIQNFHYKLMKHDYIFSANDLENVLAEFNENQSVDVQNFTTTTNTTEMPTVASGKTNKQKQNN